MNRAENLIESRNQFILKYFKATKEQNPDISIKEISVELADWFLFITPRTIQKAYYSK